MPPDPNPVIPAKPGSHGWAGTTPGSLGAENWVPAFAGMTKAGVLSDISHLLTDTHHPCGLDAADLHQGLVEQRACGFQPVLRAGAMIVDRPVVASDRAERRFPARGLRQ